VGNPHIGEVSFEAGGQSYTFKFGTYAQAVLERRTKQPAGKFFARAQEDWGVDDMLSVMYAGLYQRHMLTEEQVADIIDDIGMVKVAEVLGEAIKIANPEAGSSAADPQPAKADGIGTAF
jgi:hypothetical protein